MFRRALGSAGVGLIEEDRDGEDDQCGGEEDDAVAHEGLRLIDIVVELRRRHGLKPQPFATRRFTVGHLPCRAVVDAGLSA